MRGSRGFAAVLVASLAFAALLPGARADGGPPAAPAARGDVSEALWRVLERRMEARVGEARLLEQAGKLDEALAAYRSVETLFAEGLRDLQRALAVGPSPEGRVSVPVATRFPGRGGARAPSGAQRTSEQAVEAGLAWLAAHQSPDGSWEAAGFPKWCSGKQNPGEKPDGVGKPMYDAGVTGFALLAFGGAGHGPRGGSPYAETVSRGLAYLKAVQDPEGCFGPRVTQHYIYNHVIAALAMVEAYGMTGSPLLQDSAQKALDFIAVARNPYFGWRYGVKPGDNDTSVTTWCTMVLKSAKLTNDAAIAKGLPAPFAIDDEAFAGARAWIEKMTDPDTGRVGYIQRGSGVARPQELVDRFPADKSEAMTAAGMLVRLYTGESPTTSDPVRRGAALLDRLLPRWETQDGSIDLYYWHLGTLATFQVGGDAWKRWSIALAGALIPAQRTDGEPCGFAGSWDPVDPWGSDGGRVYSTAVAVLSLEVVARYAKAFGVR